MPEILNRAIAFIPVMLSLTVHEWAHAWAALQLGDDTAKRLGRVTLNPLAHLDPVGTVLLPLMGVPFGWAKPVPFNPTRFYPGVSMWFGRLIVAAAGPISNLILAFLCVDALYLLAHNELVAINPNVLRLLELLLGEFVLINVSLATFNLMPIPPLDGSQIVDSLVPRSLRPLWQQFTSLGPLWLFLLIFGPQLFGFRLFDNVQEFVIRGLNWICS